MHINKYAKLSYDHIDYDYKRYIFKKPYVVEISFDPETSLYTAIDNYNLVDVYEDSYDEVVEFISEDFSTLWEIYGCEDDINLTLDAILLKQTLLEIVDRVVDIKENKTIYESKIY